MTTATPPSPTHQNVRDRGPQRPGNVGRDVPVVSGFEVFTIATTVPSIGGIDVDIASIVQNWRNGYDKLLQMLQPNFEFLSRTWRPMLETLQMALVGAVASALVSIPLTLWAAKPTNPKSL